MSEQLPDLVARIRLDTSELDQAPGKAALLGGAIGGALGATLGGAINNALGAITNFVGGAVPAFAELEDATDAAAVVFGDSMGAILEQADGARDALGLTAQQVIDAANTFGTFGKSAGLAGDPLADFSTEMTELAGDLASFKGTRPEEAINAIGAALRGESEPIRRYGVLLDDATLKARALTLGIYEGTGALTPQQKVLAAQAEILAQTTDAQGNFRDTMDSTANVAKRVEAAQVDLQTAIGEALAPALTAGRLGMLGLMDSAIELVERATPGIQGFIEFVTEAFSSIGSSGIAAEFAGIGGQILDAFAPLGDVFASLAPTMGDLIPTVLQIASSLSPVHLVIDALLPVLPQLAETFATVLGEVLLAVGPLVPLLAEVAGTVGGLLGQAIIAVVPIVTRLAEIVGEVLAVGLAALTPVLGVVTELFSSLLPVFASLLDPILAVVEALLPIVELFGQLVAAILPPLAEILGALLGPIGELVASLVEALAPILELVAELLVALLGPVGELIGTLAEALAPILQLVADLIAGVLGPVLEWLIGIVADVIGWVIELAEPVLGALVTALSTVIGWLGNIIGWLGDAASWFSRVGEVVGQMRDAIGRAWENVAEWFRGLPGRILSAIGNINTLLYQAGRNVIQGLFDGIRSMASGVGDAIGGVVQTIRDFLPFSPAKLGPLSGSGSPDLAGRRIGEMLASGILAGESEVIAASNALTRAASVDGSATLRVGATGAGAYEGGAMRTPIVKVFVGDTELTKLIEGVVVDWAQDEADALAYSEG